MSNYQVIKETYNSFAVIINPMAYKVSTFSGKPSPKHLLAFNVNYSWAGFPIGHVKMDEFEWPITIDAKKELRPCLCFRDFGFASIRKPKTGLDDFPTLLQAGPTLVFSGRDVVDSSIEDEEFRSDAIRKTNHVAVGCTKAGKLIAYYHNSISMHELADFFLRHNCLSAMKCDGGSQTFLSFGENKKKVMGESRHCIAGIQFEQR